MDPLRPLWDFDDLDGSERRFREALSAEHDGGRRAELLTQLARVVGLRGDVEAGERLLDEAALEGASDVARIRIDLERGRLRRSSGDPDAALPLFEAAFDGAVAAGEGFLAGDAAHMAALAAPDHEARAAWTERGVALAESDDAARYWVGPLLNNLGWELHETGEHEGALDAFERALAAREREPENPAAIAIAQYAVAKSLRAVGRPEEGLAQIEPAAAFDEADGWFQEELAETLAALGRLGEAAAHARRALELLPVADPSFANEGARAARLQELAEASRD
jgi:tetratricopeptide (TPR) repeat protein